MLRLLNKIDRIPSFDIHHSKFDIRPARNALKPMYGKFKDFIINQ